MDCSDKILGSLEPDLSAVPEHVAKRYRELSCPDAEINGEFMLGRAKTISQTLWDLYADAPKSTADLIRRCYNRGFFKISNDLSRVRDLLAETTSTLANICRNIGWKGVFPDDIVEYEKMNSHLVHHADSLVTAKTPKFSEDWEEDFDLADELADLARTSPKEEVFPDILELEEDVPPYPFPFEHARAPFPEVEVAAAKSLFDTADFLSRSNIVTHDLSTGDGNCFFDALCAIRQDLNPERERRKMEEKRLCPLSLTRALFGKSFVSVGEAKEIARNHGIGCFWFLDGGVVDPGSPFILLLPCHAVVACFKDYETWKPGSLRPLLPDTFAKIAKAKRPLRLESPPLSDPQSSAASC